MAKPIAKRSYDMVSPDARSSAPQKRLGGVSNDARQAGLADQRNRARSYNPNPVRPTIGPKPDGLLHLIPGTPNIDPRTRKGGNVPVLRKTN